MTVKTGNLILFYFFRLLCSVRPEGANSSFMATTMIPGSRHGKNAKV